MGYPQQQVREQLDKIIHLAPLVNIVRTDVQTNVKLGGRVNTLTVHKRHRKVGVPLVEGDQAGRSELARFLGLGLPETEQIFQAGSALAAVNTQGAWCPRPDDFEEAPLRLESDVVEQCTLQLQQLIPAATHVSCDSLEMGTDHGHKRRRTFLRVCDGDDELAALDTAVFSMHVKSAVYDLPHGRYNLARMAAWAKQLEVREKSMPSVLMALHSSFVQAGLPQLSLV